MYKKGYYKGSSFRMDPIDLAGGGLPIRGGSGGSLNPYNKRSGGNVPGRTSTGVTTRMTPFARVPNTGTPSSRPNSEWAAALARATNWALQQMVNPLNDTEPTAVDAPLGWWAQDMYVGWNKTHSCTDVGGCGGVNGGFTEGPVSIPGVGCPPSSGVNCWSHPQNHAHPDLASCYAHHPTTTRITEWYRKSLTTGNPKKSWVKVGDGNTAKRVFARSSVRLNDRVLNDPLGRPRLGFANSPSPRRTPDSRVADKPSVRPATDVVFTPGRPPVIKTGEHVDEPDKKPTKKVRGVPKAMVGAIALLHGLTELADFVDALYEALPPIARCAGQRGLAHDLICVLEHADAFADPDVMAKAIGNLIANEVEDKVIGALFGSNWRFGGSFRPDNYGGTAWVGGGYGAPQPDFGFGGLISWSGSARMSPM